VTPRLPRGLARWLPPGLRPLWRLPARYAGRVLLTFDDGPSPGSTEAVLDLLRDHGLHAVFFVLGNRAARHPGLVRRIVAEGHVLGNHSHDHPRGTTLDRRGTRDQVRACQDVLREIGVPLPRWYRPPEGRLSLGALRAARELGLVPVLWTREARDWAIRDSARAEAAGRSLAAAVRSRDIVLLHDQNTHAPRLLDALLASMAGRELVVLDPRSLALHR